MPEIKKNWMVDRWWRLGSEIF